MRTATELASRTEAGSPAWYPAGKRVLDIVASGAFLLLFAPLAALIAALIRLTSRGPVFYCPQVIGCGGRPFRLLKFRTMKVAARDALHAHSLASNIRRGEPAAYDAAGRPIYKTAHADASRITSIGRFLRRTSLDEAPQFWNVLRGEMSLVGPRPSLPEEVALYDREQRRRLEVLPGITGLYQVTVRNRVSVPEMIEIDLEYLRRRGFLMDLWILLRTPAAMVRGL